MSKITMILCMICIQMFLINCYSLNHLQGNLWSDFDIEPKDEFLAKLLHTENLFHDDNSASEPFDARAHGLQKRGRQCLWKVCSWALDKRASS
ncbi:hypothetical protein I4U23_021240 [Adineta vaga]|nr:hypothetical protein I4U23_021240 [Adineta vaga]